MEKHEYPEEIELIIGKLDNLKRPDEEEMDKLYEYFREITVAFSMLNEDDTITMMGIEFFMMLCGGAVMGSREGNLRAYRLLATASKDFWEESVRMSEELKSHPGL